MREVSGYVGGNISLRCSGEWSTAADRSYFCKSLCSGEDVIIQTAGTWADATTSKGRYVLEHSGLDGAFTVTVMKLENTDTGRYHCASARMSDVIYRETYHLKILDGKMLLFWVCSVMLAKYSLFRLTGTLLMPLKFFLRMKICLVNNGSVECSDYFNESGLWKSALTTTQILFC